MMSLESAIACLKRNKSFLITSHTNLEGDALGSELAFLKLLRALGKKAMIINDDGIPYGYEFLPGVRLIKRYTPGLRPLPFDCFTVLDCSDMSRCGRVVEFVANSCDVLNIDHHISNVSFADVNWVDPRVSACAQMVYILFRKLRVPLDKESALCLYVGIMTDTGSFRYSNTDWRTHRIVAELLKYDLDIPRIYKSIYENVPFTDMQVLSSLLSSLQLDSSGKIAWLEVSRRSFRGRRVCFDLSERILSLARSVQGVEVAVLFREKAGAKGEVRVNFRSAGKVDVNRIAAEFAGGGHPNASGATVKGSLTTVRNKVLVKIKKSL